MGAVHTAGDSDEVAGPIVAYESGEEVTEAPGVVTGSSEVPTQKLAPSDAIGFGLRTTRFSTTPLGITAQTDRVSVASDATEGNGESAAGLEALAADGSTAAFSSAADNLVADDTNAKYDIFTHALATGTTSRISVSSLEEQSDGDSFGPAISGDGRYVAFYSWATNLVSGDDNGVADVFVRDTQTGTTELISVDDTGVLGTDDSATPWISRDGRYVTFYTNGVAWPHGSGSSVYVKDRVTGALELLSVSSTEEPADAGAESATLSSDGRYAVFGSGAQNLASGVTSGGGNLYLRDRVAGTTELLVSAIGGGVPDSALFSPAITPDGESVVFWSEASNLVIGDTNGIYDVFVFDRDSSTTTRISTNVASTEANGVSSFAVISDNGRYVAFHSDATNLGPAPPTNKRGLFVKDRLSGNVAQICVSSTGDEANDECLAPSITADGARISFWSPASNLVADDTNNVRDQFVHSATAPDSPTIGTASPGARQGSVTFSPSSDDGGSPVAYTVTASPGGLSGSGGTSPITVSGLTPGANYTFSVVASNAAGSSAPSAASNQVTIPNVPSPPTGVGAQRGNGQATVSWSTPLNDGGSAITAYTVTSSPGGFTCSWSSGPRTCTVTGLTNGQAYTFTVTATNTGGESDPSDPSPSVTPATTPAQPSNVTGTVGDGQVTVSWSAPSSTGGSPVTGYLVTSTPEDRTCTWSSGPLTCVVTGLANGQPYTFRVVATNEVGTGAASDPSGALTPTAPGVAGTFTALPPVRILDTRSNLGLNGAFGPQQTRSLTVVGVGGVPATHVDAVIMNVAVTAPTKPGWLTLFPADQSLPTASNMNFVAGQTVPNLVVVKVGHGGADEGKVKINNTGGSATAGTVQVIADVVGYFGDATLPAAGRFTGLTPNRILDTRTNLGLAGAFAPQQTRDLQVTGVGGVVADANAVVLNVTATGPSKNGWLTLFPAGQPLPTASNLNFVAGQTVPNLVVVKLGTAGKVSINNTGGSATAGSVSVIADVVGYYKTGIGTLLTPIAPQRILDTRNGTGGVPGPVGPQATITVDPKTATGLPAVGSYSSVIVNVTVTGTAKAGWLTVFPSDASLPTASNLNFTAGQTVPNLVMVKVGVDGKIKINNTGGNPNAGTVHIIADIVGYYT